jgi:hypothetical protein
LISLAGAGEFPKRVYLRSSACSVSAKPAFVETASEPLGPPQRWLVVAKLLRRLSTAFVEEYPIVIATTNKAPGNTAGLPTGISKYRQPTPTAKLTKRPMTNLIRSLLYLILQNQSDARTGRIPSSFFGSGTTLLSRWQKKLSCLSVSSAMAGLKRNAG